MDQLSFLSASGLPSTASVGRNVGTNGATDRKALQKQAVEFEAIYLAQMLQPIFEGLKGVEPFGGGFGEDVWRSLQVQEYGKAIAESGGIGIADQVARELILAQEAGQEAR